MTHEHQDHSVEATAHIAGQHPDEAGFVLLKVDSFLCPLLRDMVRRPDEEVEADQGRVRRLQPRNLLRGSRGRGTISGGMWWVCGDGGRWLADEGRGSRTGTGQEME